MSDKPSHPPRLGVCYYPEHWPESQWVSDAQRMAAIGIETVRIGEFAWSRLEAAPGELTFDWLARAINTLHDAGLNIILCTPTATPPRWMLDKHPDMLAVDEHGNERGFGSRRHYCFSYEPYHTECERIVLALAEAFGEHPGIVAWQTDNEYGCHDTAISYSKAALRGFRQWCAGQYDTIDRLNVAWGNVFWSMEYNDFSQIGLPVAAVTETNPAHRLAFWRYSSDRIVAFNRLQTDILRRHSPGRDLVHNYMGNFTQFDHHAVAKDLDVASWDNYPLGFLTRDSYSREEQRTYLRTGHPDSSAFHHELYRGCNNGRWWIMEQQPGPVNWAPYNPAPLDGMVRFWGWEAIAHGAEVVSYFRWRQAPFAQEQMHTGLCRPDGSLDTGGEEVALLAQELQSLSSIEDYKDLFEQTKAPVALVFDYTGLEAQRIQQPDGKTFDPLRYAQRVYSACRQLGLDVDIVPTNACLDSYQAVLVTSNTISDETFCEELKNTTAEIALMPRTGSKTWDNAIAPELAPGALQSVIPVKVVRSESLPDFVFMNATSKTPGKPSADAQYWRETIESTLAPESHFSDGVGFHYRQGRVHYVNACLTEASLVEWLAAFFDHANIETTRLPPGVRMRKTRGAVWWFNFGAERVTVPAETVLLGDNTLSQGELAAWRRVS